MGGELHNENPFFFVLRIIRNHLTIPHFWIICILENNIVKNYKILTCLFVLLSIVFAVQGQTQDKAPIFTIEVDAIINPATAKFIVDSIDQANQQGAQCLVIQLDTPGGLMDSMRMIIKKMLASNIPIIVYVSPGGARAASAGVSSRWLRTSPSWLPELISGQPIPFHWVKEKKVKPWAKKL